MNIDMGALHAIEVDRGIAVDELLDTIKSALLTAYPAFCGSRSRKGPEMENVALPRMGALLALAITSVARFSP